MAGFHLEPMALLDFASFIEGGVDIARRAARVEGAPRLSARAVSGAGFDRGRLPSGAPSSRAARWPTSSPELGDLRRSLVRLRSQLTSVMESYLRDRDADRLLQDKVVTTRNDRYVLVVKDDHKGPAPGGRPRQLGQRAQSVFVEPFPAVTLNNDIVELQDEERREVIRILHG